MSKTRRNNVDVDEMQERVFDFYSAEVEREVSEHDLSHELAEMKAFNLGEWVTRLSQKQLLKEYRKMGRR